MSSGKKQGSRLSSTGKAKGGKAVVKKAAKSVTKTGSKQSRSASLAGNWKPARELQPLVDRPRNSKASDPRPDNKRISEQIELLTGLKPQILHRSKFGDNHHDAIDAQIRVLTERLSDDTISEYYDPYYYDAGPGVEDDDDDGWESDSLKPENVFDEAVKAGRWLRGELIGDLACDWLELRLREFGGTH